MPRLVLIVGTLCLVAPAGSTRAEEFELDESAGDARTFLVTSRLEVDGLLKTKAKKDETRDLKLSVRADHRFRSRRLPSGGRDARAFRALRHYEQAKADVTVAGNQSYSELAANRRVFVARGRREGIQFYSPTTPIGRRELDLLDTPADPLAVLALLPREAQEVGDTWSPPTWATQLLTRTEAVLEGSLTCKLAAVEEGIAHVEIEGHVKGATHGAGVELDLEGRFEYHLADGYVRHFELEQTDERTIGVVSPGTDLRASVRWDRRPVEETGPLTDAVLASIPLEPREELLRVAHSTPWGVELHYGREWHLFHQTRTVAVLRLVEQGNFVTQCNVARIERAAAGKHTPAERFQQDVAAALGEQLDEIVSAEELDTGDGRYVLRVTAKGTANDLEMHWIYYLVADPDGRQASFVFAVETARLSNLAGRDTALVLSTSFDERKAPTPASDD